MRRVRPDAALHSGPVSLGHLPEAVRARVGRGARDGNHSAEHHANALQDAQAYLGQEASSSPEISSQMMASCHDELLDRFRGDVSWTGRIRQCRAGKIRPVSSAQSAESLSSARRVKLDKSQEEITREKEKEECAKGEEESGKRKIGKRVGPGTLRGDTGGGGREGKGTGRRDQYSISR